MNTKNKHIWLLLIIFRFTALTIHAQVAIAPSFVFIDERSGIGNFYVSNNGNESQEVTISFRFGYPASDSLGNQIMIYDDPLAFKDHGLDSMIRAFPRSFILPGGRQQTVRIQVLPSMIRHEGFYFTRMKILSRPVTPDASPRSDQEIATRILFNFEQVTAVFYRRGSATTGLTVRQLSVNQNNKSLVIMPHLMRQGNAPFLGTVTARLMDEKGTISAEYKSSTTVYFESSRRIEMDISGVNPGEYTLELSFDSERNDIMASDLVRVPRTVHETKLKIRPFR
jgi:hypothetical protein